MSDFALMHEEMIGRVVEALGEELRAQVAFVGGCATGFLLTDPIVRNAVRSTDDVDVIVHAVGAGPWYLLQEQLQKRGFRPAEDEVICRTRLRDGKTPELLVDFMPDTPDNILGFSNYWYPDALRTATSFRLPNGLEARIVTAPYFLGTKLEAFKGRGRRSPLGNTDILDVLLVVDGRQELLDEVQDAPTHLRQYIGSEIAALLELRMFDYAVQDMAESPDREDLIFDRLERLAALRNN